jgi:hypothetical protein
MVALRYMSVESLANARINVSEGNAIEGGEKELEPARQSAGFSGSCGGFIHHASGRGPHRDDSVISPALVEGYCDRCEEAL